MKRVFIGFIICLFLLNCAKKEEKLIAKNKPYIISYEDKKLEKYYDSIKTNTSRVALPPRKIFYAESQLIIDKKGNLYFYQKRYFLEFCSYGSEKDTLPHFLDLQPKDIVKIPETSLVDFLSENILSKEKNRRILIVASQNDTIKNTFFMQFINKNQLQAYEIRRTTQEEDTVLKYKMNNDYYYSDSIKWDRTKIKFSNRK
ncbi:hypothetical protein NJT12_16230 [Flavobacterium sp. AC]|uniref:Lipoprotein n=1 Tax=Flavobacterium azizsancarii TaxID=2961580 RepID=A0ABT4WFC3_9FLAO|nr:hypothetical protein [Flavobacterium azizsancarii]MDA6071165.1 hypothetical protein [Flavobacterium azizsancarii]